MAVMTTAEARRDAYYEAHIAQPQLHCCVCREHDATVTPCANIKCRSNICAGCQGEETIAQSLGTCDDPACAVIALRDLREMLAANLRRAA